VLSLSASCLVLYFDFITGSASFVSWPFGFHILISRPSALPSLLLLAPHPLASPAPSFCRPNGLAALFGPGSRSFSSLALELFVMKEIISENKFGGDFCNGTLDFGWDSLDEEAKLSKVMLWCLASCLTCSRLAVASSASLACSAIITINHNLVIHPWDLPISDP